MGKPDALSRRSDHGTGADDNSDVVLLTPKLFAVHALGLKLSRLEQDILHDIRQGTKQPKEEPVARAAQELRKSSTRSLQSAEWSERNSLEVLPRLHLRPRHFQPPPQDSFTLP